MAYGTVNADVIGTSVAGSNLGAGNASIMKNRIINGAMVIDQRNAGASVTPTNGQYTVDRFFCYLSQSSKYTVQQNAGSVTPPIGFTNYLGVTSTSAYSVTSTDYFAITQGVEGYNIADLGWGTANAKTVTLSFWVRSSLTGTFSGYFSGGQIYPFSYTISAANTWEQKSITIAGSTSGTWTTNNGAGFYMGFCLGAGSTYLGTAGSWGSTNYFGATGTTSVVGTSGATFYITGVQLEVGSSATGFDYRIYSTELANCQRYYWQINGSINYAFIGNGNMRGAAEPRIGINYPQTMRSSPTHSYGGNISINSGTVFLTATSILSQYSSPTGAFVNFNTTGGSSTAGYGATMYTDSGSGNYWQASAEL